MAADAQPLRVGVAGLGFGSTEYLPVLETMPEIKLVAGADLRPQALQAFEKRYGGRTYDSVEALCQDPDVEAVWISTPNQFHAEHALLAAEHGKHMCVRKPLALTMQDCQRVVDAAERNGVKVLAGGQTQGTNPLVQAIRQMILKDELGPLRANGGGGALLQTGLVMPGTRHQTGPTSPRDGGANCAECVLLGGEGRL